METLYLGVYTERQQLGLSGATPGVYLYLHCLDPNTYVVGDNVDGQCFADVPIPAAIGRKLMQGDFAALYEAPPEIAAFVSRPHFKIAQKRILSKTDPSLLRSPQLRHRYTHGPRL